MMSSEGYLAELIASGARILECTCGPCSGKGYSPNSGGISLRTNNRNFEGRSGTKDGQVYLVSPETAAASALAGCLTDARDAAESLAQTVTPKSFYIDDRMIIAPPEDGAGIELIKGPNIKGLPAFSPLESGIAAETVIKVGDNISTDHIIPSLPHIVQLRSNIPAISRFVFNGIDPEFASRCDVAGQGIIVGGHNYGQGSSREHAALAPKYLGVKAVVVKSFARIHSQNLVNFGILPLVFDEPDDYNDIEQGDKLEIGGLPELLKANELRVRNLRSGKEYAVSHSLSKRQIATVQSGGLLRQAAQQ
jgi:aconitate hydratase